MSFRDPDIVESNSDIACWLYDMATQVMQGRSGEVRYASLVLIGVDGTPNMHTYVIQDS